MTTTTAPAVRSLEADRAALLRTARLTACSTSEWG